MKELVSARIDADVKKYIDKISNIKCWTFSFALNQILKDYFKKGE